MNLPLAVEEAAASASLTRLIATDTITRPLRWSLIREARSWGMAGRGVARAEELAGCPWCLSTYTAAVVIALRWIPGGWLVRRLLAVRWVAAVATNRLDGAGRDWPPEVTWPPTREPGTFPPSDGTIAELRDEVVFWKRNPPETLVQLARRDMVTATVSELEARNTMANGQ